MTNSSFRFNSILAIVISIAGFFIQSCGGTASENTNAEPRIPGIKKDQQVSPATAVVDTNDKMNKATGVWVQNKNGKVFASFLFKYISGANAEFIISAEGGKNKVTGNAPQQGEGNFVFSGQDNGANCNLTFKFDGEKFNVQGPKGNRCGGSEFEYSGEYTRK